MGDFFTGLLLVGLAVETFGCHATDPDCNTSFLKLTQLAVGDIAEGRAQARRLKAEADEAAKVVASPEELAALPALTAMKLEIGGDMDNRRISQRTADFLQKASGIDPNLIRLHQARSLHPIRKERFSAPIPDEAWPLIAKLGELEELDLWCCDLPAVAVNNIVKLPHLRLLRTTNCGKITGDLSQLGKLTNLESLSIDLGLFQHRLHRKKMLGKLNDAEIAYRDEFVRKRPKWGVEVAEAAIVTDRLIEQLAPCTKMRALSFSNAYISARGVRALTAFPNFEDISVSFLDDSDDVIRDVGKLTHLKRLEGLDVSEAALVELGNLRELEELFLKSTLTDASIPQLLKWTHLKKLRLWNNQLTDAGMLRLAELKNLKLLDVRAFNHGRLTADGATAFRKLRPDCMLYVFDDDLKQQK